LQILHVWTPVWRTAWHKGHEMKTLNWKIDVPDEVRDWRFQLLFAGESPFLFGAVTFFGRHPVKEKKSCLIDYYVVYFFKCNV
jgi:hypothetical protein